MIHPAGSEPKDVFSAGRILKRRRGTVIVTIAAFTCLGLAINAWTPPVYRANVRLEIRRPPDPATAGVVGIQSENLSMFTAAEMISSRAALAQVAQDFRGRGWVLPAPGAGASATLATARRAVSQALGPRDGVPSGDTREAAAPLAEQIEWLQSIVSVEPVQDTRLVDIKVEHTDPEAARAIADRLARLFVDACRRRSAPDSQAGSAPGAGLDIGVDPSPPPNPVALQERIRHLEESVANLNGSYFSARGDRAAADARLSRLAHFMDDSLGQAAELPIQGGSLDGLRRDLVNCEMRLASARGVYGEKHPKTLALRAELASAQTSLRSELQRAIASERNESSALAAREAELRGTVDRYERELAAAQIQMQSLPVGARAPEGPAVEIVDAAAVEPRPIRPRKALNLAVCVAAGALAGSGLALFLHSLRATIRVPEEIESLLEIPVLGVVPRKRRRAVA